ncbi:MAG: DNA-3-methyladenine glycosylase 2 family protein [Pseudomonadota bacterium]
MKLTADEMRRAHRHLRRVDPELDRRMGGLRACELHRNRRPAFASLANAIVGQQLSTKAAASILRRVETLTGSRPLRAPLVADTPSDALREAGLSNAKTRYLLTLAESVCNGDLNFRSLARQSDDVVVERLTALPGIGEWTAQMFLMFGLLRSDVAAPGDLGLQKGMQALDGLEERPDADTFLERCEVWRPYRTVGCWYLWRLAE